MSVTMLKKVRRFWFIILALGGCRDEAAVDSVVKAPTDVTVHAAAPHVTSALTPAPCVEGPELVFVGDIALSLAIGERLDSGREKSTSKHASTPGFPFNDVRHLLVGADLAMGNLECVASSRGHPLSTHHPLRCAARALETIRDAGIDVLSVANNHAMDFGQAAFEDQLVRIRKAGLAHVGSEAHAHTEQRPTRFTACGITIGILAYFDPPYTVQDILRARENVDFLVVFNHWGREDDPRPLRMQRSFAHALIDAGADLIVGTHAHVVQDVERYAGKIIVYGLGNFVFSGMGTPEARSIGALLQVRLRAAPGAPGTISRATLRRVRLVGVGAPVPAGEPELIVP